MLELRTQRSTEFKHLPVTFPLGLRSSMSDFAHNVHEKSVQAGLKARPRSRCKLNAVPSIRSQPFAHLSVNAACERRPEGGARCLMNAIAIVQLRITNK